MKDGEGVKNDQDEGFDKTLPDVTATPMYSELGGRTHNNE